MNTNKLMMKFKVFAAIAAGIVALGVRAAAASS